MSTLRDQLADAEAHAEFLRCRIAATDCREAGCKMEFSGGMNAGCEMGSACSCSIPVHTCRRCGDSDYGDNAEARKIRELCALGEAAEAFIG